MTCACPGCPGCTHVDDPRPCSQNRRKFDKNKKTGMMRCTWCAEHEPAGAQPPPPPPPPGAPPPDARLAPPSIQDPRVEELLGVVRQLHNEVARLSHEVARLRAEINEANDKILRLQIANDRPIVQGIIVGSPAHEV